MSEPRVDCFFYGLYMDEALLRARQVSPANPRPALVETFQGRIGHRATMVPHPRARAYGMLFALTHSELERLYMDPDLESYRPEAVLASTLQGEPVAALCYTLPEPPAPDERNAEYAGRLQEVLRKLGFPEDHIASLR